MVKKNLFLTFFVCAFSIFIFVSHSQGETPFAMGMKQFNEENYEEALEFFMEARKVEPKSSVAAFYLGLTLRLMENHKEAIPHLRDAVTLTPRVKEALPELIDSLYQNNELKEAFDWIQIGEKEGISPSKLLYLKGLILSKQGKNLEAIEAFEKAKRLDSSLAQMVEFQIASSYLKEGRLKESKERFKAAISLDPKTDIGTYAREYENLISDKMYQERPFRFTLAFGYKYDTNVNARPTSGPFVDIPSLSPLLSGQKDYALNMNFRALYIAPFSFKRPYNLAVQYIMNADRYFRRDDYNSMQQNITVTPGYNFSKVSLMLPLSFGYSWLQGDNRDGFGSGTDFLNRLKWFKDAQYVKVYGTNPTARIMLSQNTVGEVSLGVSQKRYDRISSDAPPVAPEENRDGTNTNVGMGWSYFFKEGRGLLSIRYVFANEDSDGFNWSYNEHRFSVSTIYPFTKALRGQISLDGIFTNYKHENTTFGMKRRDNTYIGSFSFLYEVFKNTDIIAQYTYTRDKSNIGTYDYNREVFMVGVEFRF